MLCRGTVSAHLLLCWHRSSLRMRRSRGRWTMATVSPCASFAGLPALSHGYTDTDPPVLPRPPFHDGLSFPTCAQTNLSSGYSWQAFGHMIKPGRELAMGSSLCLPCCVSQQERGGAEQRHNCGRHVALELYIGTGGLLSTPLWK